MQMIRIEIKEVSTTLSMHTLITWFEYKFLLKRHKYLQILRNNYYLEKFLQKV